MSKLVALRNFPDRIHAELVRTFLESEEFYADVAVSSGLPGEYLALEIGLGACPHEIAVYEDDLQDADALLLDVERGLFAIDDEGEPESPSIAARALEDSRCPVCGGDLQREDHRVTGIRNRAQYLFIAGIVYAIGGLVLQLWLTEIIGVLLTICFYPGIWFLRAYCIYARCGRCGLHRDPEPAGARSGA